jgi:tetratricopeptide (TPR) repeat protein
VAYRSGVGTILLLATLVGGSSGCLGPKVVKPPADPGGSSLEAVEPPVVPLDTVTPPTEIDVILEAGREAEQAGDLESAIRIYQDAVAGGYGRDQVAGVRYHLALLYLDPSFEWRRIEESRSILQELLDMSPPFSRRTEASLVLWLLEEIERMQSEAGGLESRADTLTTEAEGLRAKLKEKEQELERIKQVLLRKEP